ncbi:MAG: hypothetical protein QOI26_2682, partial [Pseudonocardiales bacterium]|nr:hypothetical protein [Pseudonocardiales bacterium]
MPGLDRATMRRLVQAARVARLMGLNLYRGVRGSDAAVALDGGGVLHAAGELSVAGRELLAAG